MDGWLIIIVMVAAAFFAASILRTLLGGAIRYAIFVALAAFVWKKQEAQDDFGFVLEPEIAASLATIAAISFGATIAIVYVLFRNSRFKLILLPLVGFAVTFLTASVFTQ
jgi:hypothetical protein